MVRERMREREPEPIIHDNMGEFYRSADDEKEAFRTLPRVIKYDSVPWTQGDQAYHKPFLATRFRPDYLGRQWNSPIYTMTCQEQILKPGSKSGRHIHYMEAMFYIMEGKGFEVHDEVRYEWQAGDIVCVPTYTVHQHHNADPLNPARVFYVIPGLFYFLGIGDRTQLELHGDYKPPDGAPPPRVGQTSDQVQAHRWNAQVGTQEEQPLPEVKTTYDEKLMARYEEAQWRRTVPRIIRSSEMPWEDTPQGKIKWLVHPKASIALRTLECWIQELPPGGHSGKHRHLAEEVHLILEGKGYDIQDGVRWDWEKEDLVCVPHDAVHQHFNADPDKPALFLSVSSRLYSFIGHDGIEQIESV